MHHTKVTRFTPTDRNVSESAAQSLRGFSVNPRESEPSRPSRAKRRVRIGRVHAKVVFPLACNRAHSIRYFLGVSMRLYGGPTIALLLPLPVATSFVAVLDVGILFSVVRLSRWSPVVVVLVDIHRDAPQGAIALCIPKNCVRKGSKRKKIERGLRVIGIGRRESRIKQCESARRTTRRIKEPACLSTYDRSGSF